MRSVTLRVGQVAVRVESDVPEVLAVSKFALPQAGNRHASITVRVLASDTAPPPVIGAEGEEVFALKHETTFAYAASTRSYRAWFADAAWGTIDCDDELAEWRILTLLPPRTVLHSFILDPLSLLLPKHRSMICHGAAVVRQEGACLIFGKSGTGKSTLAFLATHTAGRNGLKHFADDTVLIDASGEVATAHPIQSGFGLSPECITRFGLDDRPVIQASRGKRYLTTVPHREIQARQIERAVFLIRDPEAPERAVVEELRNPAALRAMLAAQTSIASPYTMERFRMWKRIAAHVRTMAVRYRRYCDVESFLRAVGAASPPQVER